MTAQTMVSTSEGIRLVCDLDFWPDKIQPFNGVEILGGCKTLEDDVTLPLSERGFDFMGEPNCAVPSDWPKILIGQLLLGLGTDFGENMVETIKLVQSKLVSFKTQLSDLLKITSSDHANQVWVDVATGLPGALGSLVFLVIGVTWIYRRCSACACANTTRMVKEREAREAAETMEKGDDAPLLSGKPKTNSARGPVMGGEERIKMVPQGPTQSPEEQKPSAPLATFAENREAEIDFRVRQIYNSNWKEPREQKSGSPDGCTWSYGC